MVLPLVGCTLNWSWLQKIRAREALRSGDHSRAIDLYRKILNSDPDNPRVLFAARIGARVAQVDTKDYPTAIEFYRHLVLKADTVNERKNAQRLIAQIHFENIQDFNQAVIEYEKLLKLDWPPEEKFRFRLNLARSHFELNNLEQALHEIEATLAGKLTADQIFDAKVLRASIHMADKNLSAAAQSWESIVSEFPERSKKENIGLNLVVSYEEAKDFAKAIEVLESMKKDYPNPDFLEIRIQRLKDRKINQPGAQGWKR